jgi:hypothetical protein
MENPMMAFMFGLFGFVKQKLGVVCCSVRNRYQPSHVVRQLRGFIT